MSSSKEKPRKAVITPEKGKEDDARRVLKFLNTAKTPEEIAAAVEITAERDVGLKVAQNILAARANLGAAGFTSLKQVAEVPQVGPERFSEIVSSLGKEIRLRIPVEREKFRALLLKNPNYFGNIKVSPFPPEKVITKNTKYEECKCLGFNPQSNKLEAVVHIKQDYGYGGGVCSGGTQEYVRFYIDWDLTNTWQDLGIVSFTVYDTPGKPKPLEFDVTLEITPNKKFCWIENLPKVRAILEWNNPPPPNDPAHLPVWGNVRDARIQIAPRPSIVIADLLKQAKFKIPTEIAQIIDLTQKVPALKAKALSLAELKVLYKDKGVPINRFGFKEVQKLISQPAKTEMLMAVGGKSPLVELGLDAAEIADMIEKILLIPVDGDTRYEELTCVGLNANQNALVGVLTLKLPNGYLGNLCTPGSQEYVAFWVDWGAGWTYAGTTAVTVHDITNVPPEGLKYSVSLPIDLSTKRQPCAMGAKVVKVRAILSWETPPPPWNPNYVPGWGNREETMVHIKPGPTVEEGEHIPYIETVGNMAVCDIDQGTGLATGTGVYANFTANESPFGGVITISGFIADPPHYLSGENMGTKLKYKVSVRRFGVGEPWQVVSNPFTATVTEQIGGLIPSQYNTTQFSDADGFYDYLEDYPPGSWRLVAGQVLARWPTSAAMAEGIWEIKIEAKNPVTGDTWAGGTILCSDGSTRSIVKVYLDNTPPTAQIEIDLLSDSDFIANPTVTTTPAGECGDFAVGKYIIGRFKATDEHFRSYSLTVLPTDIGGVPTPQNFARVPAATSYPAIPTSGISLPAPPAYPIPLPSGIWQLNTQGMLPCGYVVEIVVRDRTIVNSGSIGWWRRDTIGFCLRESTE